MEEIINMENILYTEGLVEYLKKKKQKKLEDEEKNKLIMKIITKHQNVYDSIIKSSPHINEEEATKFLAGLFKIFDNVGIESYFKGKKIQNNGTYVTLSDIKSRNKILSIDVDLFSFEKLKKGQQPTQQKTSHKKNMLISPNKFNKITITTDDGNNDKIKPNENNNNRDDGEKERVYRNSTENNGNLILEWTFGNMIKLKTFNFNSLEKPFEIEDQIGNFLEKYYGVSLFKINQILKTNF